MDPVLPNPDTTPEPDKPLPIEPGIPHEQIDPVEIPYPDAEPAPGQA